MELLLCSGFREPVSRAASTAIVLNENSLIGQELDVPQGGSGRAFCKFGVFRCGKLAVESVEQAVDDLALIDDGISLLPGAGRLR